LVNLNNTSDLKDNSLLKHRPELYNEWCFQRNNEIGLDIYKMTKGSRKKAWWYCRICDDYYPQLIVKKSAGAGCSICSGHYITYKRSLAYLKPEVVSEWHFSKNGDLTPDKVTSGSNKKVWWTCSECKSDFLCEIYRKIHKRNCPYCHGLKVNHTNSLAAINPSLASQWHPTLNGDLTPHDITCGSDKRVWWLGKCGHEWESRVNTRIREKGDGCLKCLGQEPKDFRKMHETNTELAKLLNDSNDAYLYSQGSEHKVDWKCNTCGSVIRNKRINMVNNHGLKCPICIDTTPFPEKVIFSLLMNFRMYFETEKTFKWSNNKRYDFYIPELNCIIETHGMQHYKDSFKALSGRSLEDEQMNDRLKEKLAKENGIEHYIVLDCRFSDFEYIKNTIIKSKIIMLIDLGQVKWDDIHSLSQKSDKITILEKYNEGMSVLDIASLINKHDRYVAETLMDYHSMNKCVYSRIKEIFQYDIDGNFIKRWDSAKKIEEKFGFDRRSIRKCCRGKQKTAYGYLWSYNEI